MSFGASAIFMVEARCSEPLTYQWFKDGTPLEGRVWGSVEGNHLSLWAYTIVGFLKIGFCEDPKIYKLYNLNLLLHV